MIKQLQQAITKLSELPELEQEAIAQMIISTIETKKLVNNWDTLNKITETTLLSESSLGKDWLTEEEEKAWKNL